MTNNEIWNHPTLTKRQKTVLCYNTPVPMREAQMKFWEMEAAGMADEAEDMYEEAFKKYEAASR